MPIIHWATVRPVHRPRSAGGSTRLARRLSSQSGDAVGVAASEAVEAEVETFLASLKDVKLADGRDRMVRHGHGSERTIQTGIGAVPVRRAKVRDRGADGAGDASRLVGGGGAHSTPPQNRRFFPLLPRRYDTGVADQRGSARQERGDDVIDGAAGPLGSGSDPFGQRRSELAKGRAGGGRRFWRAAPMSGSSQGSEQGPSPWRAPRCGPGCRDGWGAAQAAEAAAGCWVSWGASELARPVGVPAVAPPCRRGGNQRPLTASRFAQLRLAPVESGSHRLAGVFPSGASARRPAGSAVPRAWPGRR